MAARADVVVIGGGPGGYVAALRAAQLGARVVLVEREHLGGVCLNYGCIPTKALLRTVEVLDLVRRAGEFGVVVGEPRLDWAKALQRKDAVVAQLVGGVARLLEKRGVEVVWGEARLRAPHQVEVRTQEGTRTWEARSVILATGSRAAVPPVPGLAGERVWTSREALALERLPESLLVVGGGPVGLEFAALFGACGVQVTVVEMLDRLAPGLDRDIGESLAWVLTQRGVQVRTGTRVAAVEHGAGALRVQVAGPAGEEWLETGAVLVAAGRVPHVEGLGLEEVGVRTSRKGIAVDERMQTNVPGVYAVGDVVGGAMLAHVAMHEGVVAAENALGHERRMDYRAVPSCIFTEPEVASVGLSEEAAREAGYEVQVGKFPFANNGKAVSAGEVEGFVKVVASRRFGEVLGLHVVGPHASDLVLEGTLALVLEATLDELESCIHPHPTLGEAVAEAVLGARGRALHSLG
ncbi:MAG: dihydrolipoyl dehydrogenase [Anaerolineae bacterium]